MNNLLRKHIDRICISWRNHFGKWGTGIICSVHRDEQYHQDELGHRSRGQTHKYGDEKPQWIILAAPFVYYFVFSSVYCSSCLKLKTNSSTLTSSCVSLKVFHWLRRCGCLLLYCRTEKFIYTTSVCGQTNVTVDSRRWNVQFRCLMFVNVFQPFISIVQTCLTQYTLLVSTFICINIITYNLIPHIWFIYLFYILFFVKYISL